MGKKNASPIIVATPLVKPTLQPLETTQENNDKKILDNMRQMRDTNSTGTTETLAEAVKKASIFEPKVFAYVPVFNQDRKKFDMYKISIDPRNDKHILERIQLRTDSESRAIAEMQQFYANDHIKKMKSR